MYSEVRYSRYFENLKISSYFSLRKEFSYSYKSVHKTSQPVCVVETELFLIDPITIGTIARSAANPDKGVINCNPLGGISSPLLSRVQISITANLDKSRHFISLYYLIYL